MFFAEVYSYDNELLDAGRQEEKIEIAKNLLSLGIDNEIIVTAAGLSIELVENLAESLENT
jgi:predicted transposase YdaD